MVINRKVDGQLNAGSVYNLAEQMNFGGSPEHKPESQLQEEFYQRMGIWCSKPARECFEWLLDQHHFVKTELEPAWRQRFIIWREGRLRTSRSWIDRPLGWAMIVLICLPGVLGLLRADMSDPISQVFSLTALIPVALVAWWMDRTIFFPRRVADRAAYLIDQWFSNNNKEGGRG